MRRFKVGLLLVLFIAGLCGTAWAGDTLADAKAKGVLIAGVKNDTKPFGNLDKATNEIVGYDIDFCKAIAGKIGVKLELKPVTSANRMELLKSGAIDMIAATMTKNEERAKIIDFSYMYFFTGQKFLVKKGTASKLADLEGKKIGTVKGSTSEKNLRKALPTAVVVTFDNYPLAFTELTQGSLEAVTTDEPILAALKSSVKDKDQYEIPNIQISDEPYGLGMRKGDKNFVDFVNATLLEMETSGDAAKIYDKWFGVTSEAPMARSFTITPQK